MTSSNLGRVFVTGADGFIGSHLVEHLVNQEIETTALCNYNSFNHAGWLEHFNGGSPPKNLKIIFGDVRDKGQMESHIKNHNTVFHLAALIAIPYSYEAPESYFKTNVDGTLNICEASLKNKVRRLVHTSTSEVYGTAQYAPIDEKHPRQGQSPYSASKIAADAVVESYFRSFDLPATTLRPFNTYGPRQSLRAIIPTVISQILARKSEIKVGSLSPVRDFNYVYDTVRAFVSLATSENEKEILGNNFNSGSGKSITVGEMIEVCKDALGSDAEIVTDEQRVRPEKSEVMKLECDARKLFAATGWESQVALHEGLQKTANWIAEHISTDKADHYWK